MPATPYLTPIVRLILSFLAASYSFAGEGASLAESTKELQLIEETLQELPVPRQDDLGGNRGYRLFHRPETDDSEALEITLNWEEPAPVDLIALIPARAYTPEGVNLRYLMPDQYELELLDTDGQVVQLAVEESEAMERSGSNGYPLLYSLSEPAMASGLRFRYQPDALTPDPQVAWAEIFCFSGMHNLAAQASVAVKPEHDVENQNWDRRFLVDNITGMGFPEKPRHDPEPWEIGWISNDHPTVQSSGWVELDLKSSYEINRVDLFPAIRPLFNATPGFGMPTHFQILTSQSGRPDDWQLWIDQSEDIIPNPGHHPLILTGSRHPARYLRVEASEFWKLFSNYPAFMGFGEIQVRDGEVNHAIGADVSVFERGERIPAERGLYWSKESLVDGYSISGKILPMRSWLEQLEKRRQLENRRDFLIREIQETVRRNQDRRNTLLISLACMGTLIAGYSIWRTQVRIRDAKKEIRNRLSNDLHDDLGSNLGCILSLSKSIEDAPEKACALAPKIQQITAESIDSTRDLIHTLREQKVPDGDLCERIRRTAEQMLNDIDWSLNTNKAAERLHLKPDVRRNLLLFLREAFHNCLRHSGASRIDIELTARTKTLTLRIEDNGCGIPPEILEKPYALFALKARSTQLSGELKIESQTGEGLCLSLQIPH